MRFSFVILLLVAALRGDDVVRELSRPGMQQKAIRVGQGPFTISHVEALARAELARKPRAHFTQLLIYGQKGGAPLPKPDHVSYDYWRGQHDSLEKLPNEIAEMVSIGDNAVLRMHDSSGQVLRKVLSGEDPLRVDIGG